MRVSARQLKGAGIDLDALHKLELRCARYEACFRRILRESQEDTMDSWHFASYALEQIERVYRQPKRGRKD